MTTAQMVLRQRETIHTQRAQLADADEALRTVEHAYARLEAERDRLARLLRALVEHEDRPCTFDHHGYCQEHSGAMIDGRCATAAARSAIGAGAPAPPAPR